MRKPAVHVLAALVAALLAALPLFTSVANAAVPSDWQVASAQSRARLTIQGPGMTGSVSNFPVEVHLPASFDYAGASATELFFTTPGSASTTTLPYEVETWNPAGTSTIWVQVPTVSAGASTLYMYYDGAPAAPAGTSTHVWESKFLMVNHFDATSGSTILDSTAGGPSGTASGTLTYGSQGQSETPAIAAGTGEISFGTSVAAENSGRNSFAEGATWSLSFFTPESQVTGCVGNSYCIIGGRDLGGGSEPGEQFSFVLSNGVFLPRVAIFKPGAPAGSDFDETLNPFPPSTLSAPATAGWHELTFTYDNAAIRWYLDGKLFATYADAGVLPSLADYEATTQSGSAKLTIAPGGALQPFVLNGYAKSGGNGHFTFDDTQVSDIPRSADWILASHLSTTNQLVTYRKPESLAEDEGDTVLLENSTATMETTATPPSESAVLAAFGAELPQGAPGPLGVDLTGVNFDEPGSYPVQVVDTSAADNILPASATVVVVPAPVVTVANSTVTFGQKHPPTAEDVVSAAGAALTDGEGNAIPGTVTADISNVDPSTPGTYTVTIVGTAESGFKSAPVTATVVITSDTIQLGESTPVLQVTGTEPTQAALLASLQAVLPPGASGPMQVTGFTNILTGSTAADWFEQPGEYAVTIADENSAEEVVSATATLEVVAVSVVTIANPTVHFNLSHLPTGPEIVSAAGAQVTNGSGLPVPGSSLSATLPAGCGTTAGSCTATIVGEDAYGFTTAPVSVTVEFSGAAVAVAHGTATFTDTGSAPSQAALVGALGATVTGSANGGQPVVDTSAVDWSVPGTYNVVVGDSSAEDEAATVAASIRIVPVPVVSLPGLTAYIPVNANDPLPAEALLANSHASLSDGEGNAVAGTLSADTSGVNGSVAGEYSATITGTDEYGFESAPVTVTVVMYLSAQQAGTVEVSGSAAVGETLTASMSGWAELASPEYQWLRDGLPIPGATAATHTVTAEDGGKELSVQVVEAPKWYERAAATSDAVAIPPQSEPKHAEEPAKQESPKQESPKQEAPKQEPVQRPPAVEPAAKPKVAGVEVTAGLIRGSVTVAGKGTLTVTATSGKLKLGSFTEQVKKGGTVPLKLALPHAAKTELAQHALKITLKVRFKNAAGKTTTVTKVVTAR
ncbi:MAG TPA: DUF2341 domain-containing protein [Solirubrobacterales bacterium]|jgi:hypothetical protein